jgi:hypothetical protein
LRAGLATGGIAGVVVVMTTTVAGTGYGWVGALDTPAIAHTWTSITTDLGYWTGVLFEALGVATMDQGLFAWRAIGCSWPARSGSGSCAVPTDAPVVGIGLGLRGGPRPACTCGLLATVQPGRGGTQGPPCRPVCVGRLHDLRPAGGVQPSVTPSWVPQRVRPGCSSTDR